LVNLADAFERGTSYRVALCLKPVWEFPASRELTVLGKIPTKRIRLRLKRELRRIQNKTLSYCEDRLSETNAEYEERRLDLIQIYDDCVAELTYTGKRITASSLQLANSHSMQN